MKKVSLLLFIFVCANNITCQTPTISMKVSTSLTIHFDVATRTDSTLIKIDFGNGTLTDKIVGKSFTRIYGSGRVGSDIKVYGDGIVFFSCDNDYLTELDVVRDTVLIELTCSGNQLTALDLSNNKALTRLDCGGNKLESLDIGKNTLLQDVSCYRNNLDTLNLTQNPELTNLSCHNNLLTSLNLKSNKKLRSLDCSQNYLTELDVKDNKDLITVFCYMNQLHTLDITKNAALKMLYCGYNQLNVLDVSMNTGLFYLSCVYNKITALNLSQNVSLKDLSVCCNEIVSLDLRNNSLLTDLECSQNKLSSLDLANNDSLQLLYCNNNQLNSLDLRKNIQLLAVYCVNNQISIFYVPSSSSFNCSNNRLSFSTIPINQGLWSVYAPQKPFYIPKDIFVGVEVDLTSLNNINGNFTNYFWITKGGNYLNTFTDYTISNGKTIFLKNQEDSVSCVMTNALFPKFNNEDVFRTTYAKIQLNTYTREIRLSDIEVYIQDNNLHICVPYENIQLSVFDDAGKLIVSKYLDSGKEIIHLENPGIYLVKLVRNMDSVTHKVFVQ